MAYDAGGIKALKPKPIGGRQRENMTVEQEKALLARFTNAARYEACSLAAASRGAVRPARRPLLSANQDATPFSASAVGGSGRRSRFSSWPTLIVRSCFRCARRQELLLLQ
jgi:hypothetical protein